MKFEEGKHYDLFGYNVVLIDDPRLGPTYFRISKDKFGFSIDMAIEKGFLENMDSTETRRLKLLFRDLENFAKSGD